MNVVAGTRGPAARCPCRCAAPRSRSPPSWSRPSGPWRATSRCASSAPAAARRAALAGPARSSDDVERACTRFDPASPLMRANADPEAWHEVPAELYDAVAEAATAHRMTGGPVRPARPAHAGGARLRPVAAVRGRPRHARRGPVAELPASPAPAARPAWQPGAGPSRAGRAARARSPIDLGGIGKGLAVRWAAERLARPGSVGPRRGRRRLSPARDRARGHRLADRRRGPAGGTDPLAVLRWPTWPAPPPRSGCASWRSGGRRVHHLIDPRTGAARRGRAAGGHRRRADPAPAEVWSKALFLAGRRRHRGTARGPRAQPRSGSTRTAPWARRPAMDELVIWRADDVG